MSIILQTPAQATNEALEVIGNEIQSLKEDIKNMKTLDVYDIEEALVSTDELLVEIKDAVGEIKPMVADDVKTALADTNSAIYDVQAAVENLSVDTYNIYKVVTDIKPLTENNVTNAVSGVVEKEGGTIKKIYDSVDGLETTLTGITSAITDITPLSIYDVEAILSETNLEIYNVGESIEKTYESVGAIYTSVYGLESKLETINSTIAAITPLTKSDVIYAVSDAVEKEGGTIKKIYDAIDNVEFTLEGIGNDVYNVCELIGELSPVTATELETALNTTNEKINDVATAVSGSTTALENISGKIDSWDKFIKPDTEVIPEEETEEETPEPAEESSTGPLKEFIEPTSTYSIASNIYNLTHNLIYGFSSLYSLLVEIKGALYLNKQEENNAVNSGQATESTDTQTVAQLVDNVITQLGFNDLEDEETEENATE